MKNFPMTYLMEEIRRNNKKEIRIFFSWCDFYYNFFVSTSTLPSFSICNVL